VHRVTKGSIALVMTGGLAFGVAACNESPKNPARDKESKSRSSNYDELVARQPAHRGGYSPTRDTKNFWIDTWMKDPKKLSYVYLQNASGEYGYFVLKGLPVSYCVSLLPPEIKARASESDSNWRDEFVQGPSMDGTYSSSSNCSTYYGKDAESGAYVEFSVSANQSYVLYDKPMNLPQFKSAKPLGPTTIKN
jgi:hypothetical protein